jgi:cobalt-zinc-cadmium efflux system outer membrane protein
MTRTLATLYVLLTAAINAAAQAPLTIERATELFLERNVEIQAARFRVDRARAEQIAARLRPNPVVTVTMENFSVSGDIPFDRIYEVGATYTETIETGGKRKLRQSVAGLTLTVAEAQFSDVLRQKTGELQRSFYEALLAQQIVGVERSNRDTIDQVVRLNTARFENGAIAEGELLKVRLEHVRADSVFRQAELAQARAMIHLLEKLEEPDLDIRALAGSFEAPLKMDLSLPLLRERAFANRPDLKAARSEIDLAQERVSLERAKGKPDLSPFVGYKRVGPNNTLTFGVTIPLAVRNRNEGGVARASGDEKVGRGEIEVVRNRVAVDVELAFRTYEASRSQVALFRDRLIGGADEAQTIALAAYEEGATELLSLLEAQRTRLEIQKEYLQKQFEYRASILDLELAIGERIQP